MEGRQETYFVGRRNIEIKQSTVTKLVVLKLIKSLKKVSLNNKLIQTFTPLFVVLARLKYAAPSITCLRD